MKKYLILSLLLMFVLSAPVYAQTDDSQDLDGQVIDEQASSALAVEEVTTADLGIPDPGLLPTNPFYFLKEWGRGFRQIFTFNPVKKVRLELRFTNEKAAELKRIEEISPENEGAIEKAIENYQESQLRLKARFENLKENSNNPNVEKLLEEFVDRAVKHTKIFDSVVYRFRDKERILELAKEAREEISEVVSKAAEKDEPAKFAAKLERVFVTEKGSELKHIRSLEILDRFSQKVPEKFKDSLERLRYDFSEKLEEDIDEAVKKHGEKTIQDVIRNLPGDDARRANILIELRERARPRVSNAVSKIADEYSDKVLEDKNVKAKALEQIENTSKFLVRLERKISEAQKTIPQSVQNHLDKAKAGLQRAKQAWLGEKYGEALGQARAAESAIRNALRAYEQERPQAGDLEQELKRMADTIEKYAELVEKKDFSEKEGAKELLEEARKHLGFAKDALAKGDHKGTLTHLGRVKGFIQKVSRLIEGNVRARYNVPALNIVAPLLKDRAEAVCERFKNNLNDLKAMMEKGRIKEEDYNRKMEILEKELRLCKEKEDSQLTGSAAPLQRPVKPLPVITPLEKPPMEPIRVPVPKPVRISPSNTVCTAQYDPVCGINGRTYSNACSAKVAGITIKHRGTCEVRESVELRECGVKPILPAPSAGCKYDGPRCLDGKWQYKLVCLKAEEVSDASTFNKFAPVPVQSIDTMTY